ncbi:hypothetical protein COT07_00050 [Candidatus Woesearchaeota archaeon CG07_land_8_20_14_0_80_44_23]|nr:MAG: hypothetical protein COT07_00050 [Candidatus Woesearchaeota archaeon CG07_land_8_20_14_0_80_44_23]
MENKNIRICAAWIALMAIIVMISSAGASAQVLPGTAIRVNMINQEPDPVDAGQYVTVKFRVENIGIDMAKNVVFQLMPDFPFSLDPGTNATKSVGSLVGVQDANNAVTLEYRIKVDQQALSGSTNLKLRYNIDSSGWVELPAFQVRVRRYFLGLSIDSIATSQEYFEPGRQNDVTISVKNMADSPMRSVSVSLSLEGTTPFAPIGSGTEKRAYSIQPGQTQNFTFQLLTSPDTILGLYKISIAIEYIDEANNNHTISDILGIVVNAKPEISVRIDSSAIKSAGSSGKITLKLVNLGIGDVRFLNLKFSDTPDLTIVSGNEQYIGQLSSDDYDTADINAYVARANEGIVEIPVTLDYSDAMGNSYEQNESVVLRIYSAAEQRRLGISSGKSPLWILLIVIIIAVGIVFYRKRKRRSPKRQ